MKYIVLDAPRSITNSKNILQQVEKGDVIDITNSRVIKHLKNNGIIQEFSEENDSIDAESLDEEDNAYEYSDDS